MGTVVDVTLDTVVDVCMQAGSYTSHAHISNSQLTYYCSVCRPMLHSAHTLLGEMGGSLRTQRSSTQTAGTMKISVPLHTCHLVLDLECAMVMVMYLATNIIILQCVRA